MADREFSRDSKRIPFKQKVKFGGGDAININSISLNLSSSGISLKSYKALPPGSKISVVIYCEDKPLNIEGEVIWNKAARKGNDAEMGIKITSRKDDLLKLYESKLHKLHIQSIT